MQNDGRLIRVSRCESEATHQFAEVDGAWFMVDGREVAEAVGWAININFQLSTNPRIRGEIMIILRFEGEFAGGSPAGCTSLQKLRVDRTFSANAREPCRGHS